MSEKNKNDRDLIMIISKVYQFIGRYFIILLLFLIMGLVYGWYKNYTAGYFYKRHLVINSIVIEKYLCTDMVYSLQTLVTDNSLDALAKKMNIPEKAAASIIKFDTSTFHYRENVGFIVDLSYRDDQYADTLTSGLLYFLNNNEYNRKNMQLFIQERQKMLKAINNRLGSSDSTNLGATSVFSASHGENAVFIRSASSEHMRTMEEKYRIEKDIELGKQISLVEKTTGKVFAGMGLTKSLILYGLGIGILGVFLSLFIESLRLSRKYLKEQK